MLQVAKKAYEAFVSSATPRGSEKPRFDRDFWAINRSGKGQQSQTNFLAVKLRDVEEDWPEIFDTFDIEELDEIIEEAKEHCFEPTIIPVNTRKELDKVADYLASDED